MNNKTKKTVFIIDLDGTIVGDVKYQAYMFSIYNILKNISKEEPVSSCSYCIKKINNDLKEMYSQNGNLVRKYFKEFVSLIHKYKKDAYIFIYTASEKKWANYEISCIEKNIGYKFTRPILTRDDCIITPQREIKKSVSHIFPKIKRKIGIKTYEDLIQNHELIVIDNNPVFLDCNRNFILCPSYNYILFTDLTRYIPTSVYKSEQFKNFIENNEDVCPFKEENYDVTKMYKRSIWIVKKYINCRDYNKEYKIDDFWLKMIKKYFTSDISKKQNNHSIYKDKQIKLNR